MRNYRSYIILAFVIIIASYYRLLNLGIPNFWVDEYYHVFVSRSIIRGTGLILPSGLNYWTALPFSLVVTAFQSVLGTGTFTARLPSVIFGLILIPTVYFLLKKYVSEKTALITAVFIAFDPFSFWWSRIARMYSMFELFFFVSAILLFSLLSDISVNRKKVLSAFVFIVIFSFTLFLQVLGIILIVVAAFYLIVSNFLKIDENRNFYLNTAAVLTVVMTIIALYLSKSFTPSTYYLKVFAKLNPLFIILVAAGFGYSLWKKHALGIFSGTMFFIPFVIHSFFFPEWTHSRYILYAIPFAYLTFSIPIADYFDSFLKEKKEVVKNLVAVLSVVTVIIFSKIIISHSYKMNITTFPNYQKAVNVLKRNKNKLNKTVIISTLPVATTYYYGKTDYYLRSTNFQRYIFQEDNQKKEIYTGAVLVKDDVSLKEIAKNNEDVWVFSEERLYLYNDETIRKVLQGYFKPVYVDKESKITLYRNKNKDIK